MSLVSPVTLKEMFYQKRFRPLPNYLNLWSIEENVVIGVDLQMSYVYEIIGRDLLHMTEQELDVFFRQIQAFLHSVPDGYSVVFVIQRRTGDEKKLQQYSKNIDTHDELTNFIVENKLTGFRVMNPSRTRYLFYITSYPQATDMVKVPLFKIFKPDYKALTEKIHSTRIEQLNQTAEVLVSQLKTLGIQVRQLLSKEITQFLYEHLNPGRSEYLDFNSLSKELTLRSQIVFNACENEFSQTFIDGYYYRAINLHTRPNTLSYMHIIEFLSNITGEFDFVLSVDSPGQETLEKQLRTISIQSTVIGTINPFKKYHEADLKARDSADLIEYTKENFQRLYNISLCVLVRDTTLESLTRRTNDVVAEFRHLGEAEGVIDDMNHFYLYLSVLPGHTHFNLRKHIFHSEAISQMLPVHQPWPGTTDSKMLFLTREHDILPLDLFDSSLPAKHGLVLGTTGSGKSFTTNFLLTNFFIESEKNNVIIIDIGASYRKLCQLFGGEYLEIELSEKYSFNPFPSKDVAIINKENFELDPDIVNYLKLLVQKMLKRDALSGEESMILQRAIENTYKYSKYDTPILSNLHYQLARYTPKGVPEESQESTAEVDEDTKKIARQFAKDLEYWTSGIYGKMVNRSATFSPSARLVVFDLQKLQEHTELLPIVFFMIQNLIWSKLQDKRLRKLIVFDECWKFFNDKTSAELIENLYRTARKFNAMILSISQSPDDFMASAASSAVLSNSYTKYILLLQKGHELLDKFGLSEPEIEEVKTLTSKRRDYSEVFVKFAENSRIVKIKPTKCDYWVCTTDPDDFNVEMKIRKENPQATELEILKKLIEGG
ncbi:MAG: ATP-binding protein [Elusimicrobiota bacterium]|nr:ATP-binding protein [Elusimicrobiota bacterium]